MTRSALRLLGMRQRPATMLVLAALLWAMPGVLKANPVESVQTETRLLRVATGQAPPFVLRQGDTLTGFSVDLWNELARRLNRQFLFVDLGALSSQNQVDAVSHGDADVAISAIAITAQREALVDFSVGIFDSGLQIIVRDQSSNPFLTTIMTLFSPAIAQLMAAGIAIVFLLANVLWFVERRNNPTFQQGYLRGMADGLWGVMLIIATGEHGDRDAPGVVKRCTVAFMWLFGVVLVAQFTATVTSSLTVEQMQSSIRGPADLAGKEIGTVPGSVAANYLHQVGLPFKNVASADDGYTILVQGKVQAIVYDAPMLQYWAAKRGQGLLRVVGPIFRPEKYGIAVAAGSLLRKQINEALLAMYADGTYENIYDKWFAR